MTPLQTVPAAGARKRRAASLGQALRWQLARLWPTWHAPFDRASARPSVAAAGRPAR